MGVHSITVSEWNSRIEPCKISCHIISLGYADFLERFHQSLFQVKNMWNTFVSCISVLFSDYLYIGIFPEEIPLWLLKIPLILIRVYWQEVVDFECIFISYKQQTAALWFKGMILTASWSEDGKNPEKDNDMPKNIRNSKAALYNNRHNNLEWIQGQEQNCHLGPQFQKPNHIWPRCCHERSFLALSSNILLWFWLIASNTSNNNTAPGKITGHIFK